MVKNLTFEKQSVIVMKIKKEELVFEDSGSKFDLVIFDFLDEICESYVQSGVIEKKGNLEATVILSAKKDGTLKTKLIV